MANDKWYRDRMKDILTNLPYLEQRYFRRCILQHFDWIRNHIKKCPSGSLCLEHNREYQIVFFRPEDLDEALKLLI